MLMIVPVSLLRAAERGRGLGSLFEAGRKGASASSGNDEREGKGKSGTQICFHELSLNVQE